MYSNFYQYGDLSNLHSSKNSHIIIDKYYKSIHCVSCFSCYKCTTLLLLFYKRFFCFCFAELGKDERFRGKFKKKEGNKTGLSIKKVPQRLKVAGDDPDAKMTGYLHKVYYTFRISGFLFKFFIRPLPPVNFSYFL